MIEDPDLDARAAADEAWEQQQRHDERTAFDDEPEEESRQSQPNGHADDPQPVWIDDQAWIEADLPRRRWVAPGFALRGAVTVVTGPPGLMKSGLMLAWACAGALGREHGRFRPDAAAPVVIYNVEDDQAEQRRRLSATLRQFNGQPSDIAGKVIRIGPLGTGRLFENKNGHFIPTAAMWQLRELLSTRHPSMLIVDPLVELHPAEENDNTALRTVIAEFRALATEFDLAVIIVHHTRKGAPLPGDPDSARGASAIVGAARIVLTIVGMSEEDARALGISKDRKTRTRFVRLDDAKQNYAPIDGTQWFEKVLCPLDNGETAPAAVPWAPPNIWACVLPAVANAILDEIDAGIEDGKRRYSDAPNAKDRAAWRVVQRHVPSLTDKQARKIIKTWRDNNVLLAIHYEDPVDRKPRQGLVLNPVRRPGNVQ